MPLFLLNNPMSPSIFRAEHREHRGLQRIFSRENMLAVGLCVVVILLLIATTDSAPQWIYQGF